VVTSFWGTDQVELYEPMKLRMMADSTKSMTLRYIQLYPLLVVIPTGFLYLEDQDHLTEIYIRGRIGNRKYIFDKVLTSFVVTFLTFFIPFILEIVLLGVAFPLSQTGDLSNISDYEEVVQEMVDGYLFSDLYIRHPVLYAVAEVTMWGITAGLLGCFSTCVSMFGIKLRALVFLPVYILLYVVSALENLLCTPYTTNYMWYMLSYDTQNKSDWAVPVFDGALLLACVIITLWMMRRDCRK
jgi:hypothetical protein